MGFGVGIFVGRFVGGRVGNPVGLDDGFFVGLGVGGLFVATFEIKRRCEALLDIKISEIVQRYGQMLAYNSP